MCAPFHSDALFLLGAALFRGRFHVFPAWLWGFRRAVPEENFGPPPVRSKLVNGRASSLPGLRDLHKPDVLQAPQSSLHLPLGRLAVRAKRVPRQRHLGDPGLDGGIAPVFRGTGEEVQRKIDPHDNGQRNPLEQSKEGAIFQGSIHATHPPCACGAARRCRYRRALRCSARGRRRARTPCARCAPGRPRG